MIRKQIRYFKGIQTQTAIILRVKIGRRVAHLQFIICDMDMYPELVLKEEKDVPTVIICTDQHWVRHLFVKVDDDAYAVAKVYGMDIKYITDHIECIEELYNDVGVYYVRLGKNARFEESSYYPTQAWQNGTCQILPLER